MSEINRGNFETLNGGDYSNLSLDARQHYRGAGPAIHNLNGTFDQGYWIVQPREIPTAEQVMVEDIIESPSLRHQESDYFSITSSLRLWSRAGKVEDYQILLGTSISQDELNTLDDMGERLSPSKRELPQQWLRACVPFAVMTPEEGLKLEVQDGTLCRLDPEGRLLLAEGFEYEEVDGSTDPVMQEGDMNSFLRDGAMHMEFALSEFNFPGEPLRKSGARAFRTPIDHSVLFIAGIAYDPKMSIGDVPEYVQMCYKDKQLDLQYLRKSWRPYLRTQYNQYV